MSNKIKNGMNKIKTPKEPSERNKIGINHTNGKFLFYAFIVIFLCITTYLYRLLYLNYIPWKTEFLITLTTVAVYLLLILPLTVFIAEKFSSYLLCKVLFNQKRFLIFSASLIMIPIAIFSVKMIYEYKEKPLDSLFDYNSINFETMVIDVEPNVTYQSSDVTDANELIDFLSQYTIKKMKDSEWNSDVSNENGVQITFYMSNKNAAIVLSMYENRLTHWNGHNYYVTNTSIDIDHLKDLVEHSGNYQKINNPSNR